MYHYASYFLLLSFLVMPNFVSAQLFPSTTGVVPVNTLSQPLAGSGSVDLIVEAETYKPSFYRGRSEPTVGNNVRLIAVPLGQAPENFTYQWSVANRALPETGPVAFFSDLFNDRIRISVSVIDKNGVLFGHAEEIIQLSKPEVVFYEENVLRGHGSRAITDSHALIGDEGVIRAEPYFIGLQADPAFYRAAWKVNGQLLSSGGDWRQLLFERPQEPLANYRIEFTASNRNNLAEVISGRFNLNFGL